MKSIFRVFLILCLFCGSAVYISAANEPIISVDNYTVSITEADDIEYIRYALGVYETSAQLKRAQYAVTLNSRLIAAGTTDGVFSRNMDNGGIYTFWLKCYDGREYLHHADLTYMTQHVTSKGVMITLHNLYGVKDFFIAEGDKNSYAEIKSDYIFSATYAKFGSAHDYTHTVARAGLHTVYVRYADASRANEIFKINLTVDEPVFAPDGLRLTVSNLPDIKVIRSAYGEYSSSHEVKAAQGCRNFTNKYDIKNRDSYTVQYRQEGIVTLSVEYNNGYVRIYHYNVVQKRPEVTAEGKSLHISGLDDLYVIRYAEGSYTTSQEIKNAPGSSYIRPTSITGDSVDIPLNNGVYTFCVQYNDESFNYYNVEIGADIPENVMEDARALGDRVAARQSEDSFTFAFWSDAHVGGLSLVNGKWISDDASTIAAGQALDVVNEISDTDLVVFGGDLSTGNYTTTRTAGMTEINNAVSYLSRHGLDMPALYVKGNHDDAPFMSRAEGMTEQDLYNIIGVRNVDSGAVIDDSNPYGIYGYRDFPDKRMRVIYLNTDDKPGWARTQTPNGKTNTYLNAHNISAAQLSWLANTALDFSGIEDAGRWGIIVVSHTSLDETANSTYTDSTTGNKYTYNTYNAVKILTAYITGDWGSITHNGESFSYDFRGRGEIPTVYCCVHGHDHKYIYSEMGVKKIPSIGCPNLDESRVKDSDDGVTYEKTQGTSEYSSFSLLTLDRAEGIIYADHGGAGYDRTWQHTLTTDYRNEVPYSTYVDSTEIFYGAGYLNDYRVFNIVEPLKCPGYVVTGIIPWYKHKDTSRATIYIKGATLDLNDDLCKAMMVRADGGTMRAVRYLHGKFENQETKWTTYFDIEQLGEDYYRLVAKPDSVIGYHVSHIQLDFRGVGDDLIITLDDPIE